MHVDACSINRIIEPRTHKFLTGKAEKNGSPIIIEAAGSCLFKNSRVLRYRLAELRLFTVKKALCDDKNDREYEDTDKSEYLKANIHADEHG